MFFTRLRLPCGDLSLLKLAQAAWSFPLIGALVGLVTGATYYVSVTLGLSAVIAAWIALALQVALTGALHEDGLADTADALGPHRTREEKLAIMNDSRIGTYGVVALILSLGIRAAAILSLPPHYAWVALALAGAGSRAMLAALLYTAHAARESGLAQRAGKPPVSTVIIALALPFIVAFYVGPLWALIGLFAIAALACVMQKTCETQFGGMTGDTLGAAQQLGEIMLLVLACASMAY